jgi:hypothetical protein
MNPEYVLAVLIAAILALAARPRWLPLVAVAALGIYAPVAVGRAQTWNLFHYWLNTKYFAELGYHELYNCAYDAAPHLWGDTARDLATYQIVPITDLPQCRAEFTSERWQQFTSDLEWLAANSDPWLFPNAIRDKGLNTSPTWLAVAIPLAQTPAGSPAWWLVVYADTIALIIALAAIWRWHGLKRASLAAIALATFPGTLGQLMGHWLQYPWLVLLIVSWLAWGRGRAGLAGGAIALAAALRVFPVALFAWPLLNWRAIGWRFWAGAALAGLGALLLGSLTPAGLSIWPDFLGKMGTHSGYITIEPGNLGIRQQITVAVDPLAAIDEWYAFAQGDPPPDLAPPAWVWLPAIALAGLGLAAIARRRQFHYGDGLLIIYPLLVLSRYYYAWLVLNVLEASDRENVSIFGLFLMAHALTYWGHPLYAYTVLQYGLLVYVFTKSVSVLGEKQHARILR